LQDAAPGKKSDEREALRFKILGRTHGNGFAAVIYGKNQMAVFA